MKVRNMLNENGNEAVNQFLIFDDSPKSNKVVFQSYDATIAEIDFKLRSILIYPAYDYSVTTGKYRNMFFARQGFPSLATKKGLEKAMEQGRCGDFDIYLKGAY